MKRKIFSLALILATLIGTTLVLTGCGDSNSGKEKVKESIIGTWYDDCADLDARSANTDFWIEYTFKENGIVIEKDNNHPYGDTYKYTYDKKTKKLVINKEGYDIEYDVIYNKGKYDIILKTTDGGHETFTGVKGSRREVEGKK